MICNGVANLPTGFIARDAQNLVPDQSKKSWRIWIGLENCDRDTVKQLDNAAGCRSRGPLETSVDGRGVQKTRHTGRGGYQEEGSSSLSLKGRCGEKTARAR